MSDLIDRQTAIDQILRLTHYDTVRSLYEATVANKYEDCYEDGIMDAIDVIVGLASTQPERKTGRWITDYLVGISGASYRIYRCSECASYYESVGLWPRRYCPNCGAKMEDGDGEG